MKMPKKMSKFQEVKKYGQPQIRVYHKKAKNNTSPRYLLKCGDCNNQFEIYYDKEDLEINGVFGCIQNWRDILLPLLLIEQKDNKLKPVTKSPTRTRRPKAGK